MWITASLRQRAGALAPVAESFLDGWLGADAGQYRGGRDGLVALCRQLERFMYRADVDDESERRFVEGAGALLGVLLIEHIGDACHAAQGSAHRVRLGASGFFDPFEAVDRVLDAPCIRSELAREVERAEAEARCTGPISRVVSSLRSALARERPDLQIEEQFECKLKLRHLPARRHPRARPQARGREHARSGGARGGERHAPTAIAAARRTRQRPRDRGCEAAYAASAGAGRCGARPVGAGAERAARRGPCPTSWWWRCWSSTRAVRATCVRAKSTGWGMAAEEAFALAMDNLRARSERARIVREQADHGPTYIARTGDGRDSARVLLPELYTELAERVGPEVCIAVPHRDTFMVCDGSKAALVQRLAQRAAEDAARAPHALSARVHRLTEAGLR